MQIIHSLTVVNLADGIEVEIPTFHLQLPIQRNADHSGWNDNDGNPVSPTLYIQHQLDLYGFENLCSDIYDNLSHTNYRKLAQQEGAWNICGIQNEQLLFANIITVEDQEVLSEKQIEWLKIALDTGLSADNFALIELE